jgi:Zn-dependent protease with chaperone function
VVEVPQLFAFCFGWARPQVCVSRALVDALSPAELEAVLRHEARHVRRRDPLRLLLVNTAGAMLCFIPVLRQVLRIYLLRQELAADAAAVREMHTNYPLASALYKVLTGPAPRLQPDAVVGAFTAIDVRIDHLVDGTVPDGALRAPRLSLMVSMVGVLAVAAVLCLLIAAWRLGPPLLACPAC